MYTKSYDFYSDFEKLGIKPGDTILMHSSMKSLQTDMKPEEFLQLLCDYLGEKGTLLLPTLSFDFVNKNGSRVFIANETPCGIGLLPNVFFKMDGVVRSLHPTHSCAAKGYRAKEMTERHILDDTPVGPNSPFRILEEVGGKILMLGDVNNHNTYMHGMEEIAGAPYCLTKDKYEFKLIDADGKETVKEYYMHDFREAPVQAYYRAEALMPEGSVRRGKIAAANCTLLDVLSVKEAALKKFKEDIWYFVERKV